MALPLVLRQLPKEFQALPSFSKSRRAKYIHGLNLDAALRLAVGRCGLKRLC